MVDYRTDRRMAYYRAVGDVPPKRHTQHRDPDGNLYREELMGEEGFSSDSSLLYHRGVPSAIVASEVWELPDQTRTPNHPLKPRHLQAARPGDRHRRGHRTGGWCSATTTSGSGTSSPARTPRRTTATRSATSASTSRRAAGTVETVFGLARLPRRRLRRRPAGHHAPLGPGRAEPALPDRGQQPRRAAQALPVPLRAAARARAVLRARPPRPGRAAARRGHGRRGAGQAPHQRRESSAPG